MEPRTLHFIAKACGGEVVNAHPEAVARRVVTDSRLVEEGDLFWALKGERFDGHDFVGTVLEKQPVAAVVERSRAAGWKKEQPLIVVEETRRALGQFAGRYRQQFGVSGIAVGGSNGKTSTKELIRAVLEEKFRTLASAASFNNDVGVPLTLLELKENHEVAVLEVGTNHPGELKPLLEMIRPRYGVITSIGREHLEFFHDLEGVAEEEGWVGEILPVEGRLYLHGDSPEVERIRRRTTAQVLQVGMGAENQWRVSRVEVGSEGTAFVVESPFWSATKFEIGLLGKHQAVNATFAIAIGTEFGMSREEVQRGLSRCKGARMRMEIKKVDDVTILDDSYNANADSMCAALDTLSVFPCKGRKIAVLGDMGELGEETESAHREVGAYAAAKGVDVLVGVGKFGRITVQAAQEHGVVRAIEAAELDGAKRELQQLVRSGDVLLVKASRASGLERLVEFVRQEFEKGQRAGEKA